MSLLLFILYTYFMGLLIDGIWHDKWYDTKKTKGKFVRTESQFRHPIAKSSSFEPEPERYHLYISHACPWAHRTLIFLKLKKLDSIISYSSVHPLMLENGWEFLKDSNDYNDPIYNLDFLYKIYLKAKKNYTGRVTVPILFDKKNETIVNNESSEIIRFLNTEFNDFTTEKTDFYPIDLKNNIDEINSYIYSAINNGVYKCGFATEQHVYEDAYENLFKALDQIEDNLDTSDFLVGDRLTEADIRLFTTLIRFDCVYHGHFKCNKKQIKDYPAISRYLNRLFKYDAFNKTTFFNDIKSHYYESHPMINPTGIVPKGPELNF